MTFPEPPVKGQPVRAELIRQIIDCLRMFRPINGMNVRTDVTPGGTIINAEPGGGGGVYVLAPFTVRYHKGHWEIYLPDGCCNYGGACTPINESASSVEGHERDDSAWRLLYLDDSEGTTGIDDDGYAYREWDVEIHVKPSAKIWEVDPLNNPARRLVWACAVDRLKPAERIRDADRYENTPGDSWSCVVARVRVRRDKRKVTQLRTTPVDVADLAETQRGFALVWYFTLANGSLLVEHVYCIRQVASAAGIVITGDEMTDVVSASESVYARIDATNMLNGAGVVDVMCDPNGTSYSGPHVVWLLLYEVNHHTVTADYRAQALTNIQLFHA